MRALGAAFIAACWGVLLAIVVPFGMDVWTYRHVDAAAIVADLPVAITRDPGPTADVELTLPAQDGAPEVLVFGESTVGMEPELLRMALEPALAARGLQVQISNYGTSGWTSRSISARVDAVLDAYDQTGRHPSLVLVYSGHNDYTNAFFSYVTRDLRFQRTVIWLWRLPFRARAYWGVDEGYAWFERGAGASLGLAAQRAGLVSLPDDPFPGAKATLTNAWGHNARQIARRVRESGAAVAFYTPAGNLEREPYGALKTTTDVWRAGLATTDYAARIRLLVAARDAEIVSPDLRADTQLQDRVRAMADGDDVVVIDLQRD